MRRLLLLACCAAPLACYVNAPADLSARPLAPGDLVALDISDQGRVGLSERFGAGVTQIEGRLRAMSATAFELNVTRVSYVRDGESQWAGERVTIDRQHVGRVYERRLSRQRTVVAAGVAIGSIVAFAITRAIISEGREPDDTPEPPGPISTRYPHFQIIH